MSLFGQREYTRSELVQMASLARGKKNVKKAIALYNRALEKEPDDPDIQARLAPLLADAKHHEEAQ